MSQHSHVSIASGGSRQRRHPSKEEVYNQALRIAYLKYLQAPRKRITVAAPAPPRKSYTSSAGDVLSEFTKSSKSAKLPKADFLTVLQKRLELVVTNREVHREYNDANIKKVFAVFLNQLMEPKWRESVKKSRRAEDIILIFVTHATRELNSALALGNLQGVSRENVGLLVDRHIALFVRLILFCIDDNGWTSGHQELVTKLRTLEQKLLAHDQNLAEESPTDQAQITTEAPLSYNIADMPMAQMVGRIFQIPAATVQKDIDRNRSVWTAEAAVRDLKMYNENLNMNRYTLKPDDFDTDTGYDNWKRNEAKSVIALVQQMVIANPSLAATNTNARPAQLHPNDHGGYGESSDNLSLNGSPSSNGEEHPYTFIPPDPRASFKYLLKISMLHDLHNFGINKDELETNDPVLPIYSKETIKLIEECCLRWRIPDFSKAVIFLEVAKDRYLEQRIDLDAVDAAFEYYKDIATVPWSDWTMSDQNAQRRMLASFYDGLLAVLQETVLECFGTKTQPIAPIVYVLNTHIRSDPLFSKKKLDDFIVVLKAALEKRAADIYTTYTQDIPQSRDEWDMYHVVDLGKKLLAVAERMQKRYSEPVLKQISIPRITIEVMFPAFAEDVELIIQGIFKVADEKEEDLDIQDAWDMYAKLVEVREVYVQVFDPETHPFPFSIEDTIQRFTWKWLSITDSKVIGWVDAAIKSDKFATRGEDGREPTNEERHSLSVDDIFRAFTQTTKTLKDLNWGDQYQEAKFFTALSKSFGSGLTHYCEILESMFTAEMDRLTPEQEAALQKTRQEKLLSFFNTKEKIEPFNFLPETCVKFNNIEYAIQQLDLIEASVNVDKQAAIIAKHIQTQQRSNVNKSYVFTIKIVEAEDLKACDINGLSDPYVVLGDEYQKRLAKTRVVYSTLNPRFDETVEITTQGPVLLTATIWDYDTIGEHDYVGRQSIKLDPNYFGDFQPREFWLDLDEGGRLLLKVSMEGERDDIQFYFGRTFRTLKRTERDMARQITDKCSAYIRHCLSRVALKNLLSKGISIASLGGYFSRMGSSARPMSVANGAGPTETEVEAALDPLFTYFNENFEILDRTLTREALINVMMKLWKEVLATLETLLVPPLSEKPSSQKPLDQKELEVVFKWLKMLFNFFSAPDETGQATGVAVDVLRSPKYHDLQSLGFFYFDPTEDLIRNSERIAKTNQERATGQQQNGQRPMSLGVPGSGALMLGVPMARRSKSVLMNRNLGTMRKAKEEKKKEAQAEANDDMILRILRMRPDAVGYLRARLQEKERLEAQKAAEAIVQQSIASAGRGGLRPGGLLGDRR